MITAYQPILRLNLRKVNQLFPGFSEGDFAVIYGSNSVTTLTSLLCVRAQLPIELGGLGSKIVFIDGGNGFRLYQIARIAQIHHLNPKQALQKLKEAIKNSGAKIAIVSDITELFSDNDLTDYEAQRLFSQITTYLSNFTRQNRLITIATDLPHRNQKRNHTLHTLTCQKASTTLSLNQTKYARTIHLYAPPTGYVAGAIVLRNDGNVPITGNATLANVDVPSDIELTLVCTSITPTLWGNQLDGWMGANNLATGSKVEVGQYIWLSVMVTMSSNAQGSMGAIRNHASFSYSFDIVVTAIQA